LAETHKTHASIPDSLPLSESARILKIHAAVVEIKFESVDAGAAKRLWWETRRANTYANGNIYMSLAEVSRDLSRDARCS
jgi:hypothetical protein